VRVQLASETDVAGFRAHARQLLATGIAPDAVVWATRADDGDLFGDSDSRALIAPTAPVQVPHVPPSFIALCETVALHRDPQRYALLYRLLWRFAHEPQLRHDPLDADVLQARQMAHAVGRDIHKMRAFVRFRRVERAGEAPLHVAWFEPDHYIVEANAPWFMRRFTQMHWAILTPERSAAWDGEHLLLQPGARREDAPAADAGEQLWLTYYRSIFNPARLKLEMMTKEMPRRYWKNLPEAQLITPLAAHAHAVAGEMVAREGTQPRRVIRERVSAPAPVLPAGTLEALRTEVQDCRACPLGALATQAVHGEGARGGVMFVGEQPGDQEDLAGQLFVGPAGQLLHRGLDAAGVSREHAYFTNAVRHFGFQLRGRRRIHKTPGQREIAACSRWLEEEIALVKPQVLIALGATAARSLLGRPVAITSERGQWQVREDGLRVLVTWHPSALLRMSESERAGAWPLFVADLAKAAR